MRLALLALAVLVACGPATPRKTYVIVGDAPPEPESTANAPESLAPRSHVGPKECGPRGWADCVVSGAQGISPSTLKTFREYFVRRCAEYDVASCVKLGIMMLNGDGGPEDVDGALAAFSVACELDPSPCAYVALALQAGDGVPKSEDLAAKVFHATDPPQEPRRYEDLRARRSTSLYGDDLAAEDRSSLDVVWAYERDCDRGNSEACAKAGVMYEQAPGSIERNPEEAFRLFWVACDLDKSLCMDISQAYAEGEKVTRNKKHAKRFRKQALSPERSKEAARCRYGAADKCVTFAFAYLEGEHVGRDEDYAAVLFDEACRAGNARGCAGLADLRWSGKGTYKDRHASVDLFEKACDGKLGSACWKLGRLYMRGEETEQDLDRAKQLFERACILGDQAGCKFVDSAP